MNEDELLYREMNVEDPFYMGPDDNNDDSGHTDNCCEEASYHTKGTDNKQCKLTLSTLLIGVCIVLFIAILIVSLVRWL